MMEIRFSNKNDVKELKLIWKICFNDTEEYINFFFDNMFKDDSAVVAVEDGKVVGVVHLLCAEYKGKPFKYGYAIGVLPEYRGNSLCQKMHEFIKALSVKEGFIYGLHPANDKLASFYKSIGLDDMYSLKIVKPKEKQNDFDIKISDISAHDYFKTRENSFDSHISWDLNTIKYMIDEAKHFGGYTKKIEILGNTRIFLAKIINDTVYVKETTMSDEEVVLCADEIKKYFNCKDIVFYLPNNSRLNGEIKTMIYGFGRQQNDVYMNLFFD